MENEEAAQLVKHLSPSLSDDDAAFVAEALDGYPLIIEAVCGYSNITGLNIRDLCRSLQSEPGLVRTKTDERLRDVVELIVHTVRESCPLAIELLAFRVSVDSPSEYYLADSLYSFVREYYGPDIAPTKYAAAVKKLRDTFLARFHGRDFCDDDGDMHSSLYMGVHPLIKSILFDVLRKDVARVDAMLCECLERLVGRVRQGMEQRPPDRPAPALPRLAAKPKSESLVSRIVGLSHLLQRTSRPLDLEGVQHIGQTDTGETRRSWFLFEMNRIMFAPISMLSEDEKLMMAYSSAMSPYRNSWGFRSGDEQL